MVSRTSECWTSNGSSGLQYWESEIISDRSEPQQLSRSISNRRRISERLEDREHVNIVYMRSLMKDRRRNFRKNLPEPIELLTRRESKRRGKVREYSHTKYPAQIIDYVELNSVAHQPPHRSHPSTEHAYEHNKVFNSEDERAEAIVSSYLADVGPYPSSPDLEAGSDGWGEEDGICSDDAPTDDATIYSDYSYIYDLYLE